jgi:hypothetical protein
MEALEHLNDFKKTIKGLEKNANIHLKHQKAQSDHLTKISIVNLKLSMKFNI